MVSDYKFWPIRDVREQEEILSSCQIPAMQYSS